MDFDACIGRLVTLTGDEDSQEAWTIIDRLHEDVSIVDEESGPDAVLMSVARRIFKLDMKTNEILWDQPNIALIERWGWELFGVLTDATHIASSNKSHYLATLTNIARYASPKEVFMSTVHLLTNAENNARSFMDAIESLEDAEHVQQATQNLGLVLLAKSTELLPLLHMIEVIFARECKASLGRRKDLVQKILPLTSSWMSMFSRTMGTHSPMLSTQVNFFQQLLKCINALFDESQVMSDDIRDYIQHYILRGLGDVFIHNAHARDHVNLRVNALLFPMKGEHPHTQSLVDNILRYGSLSGLTPTTLVQPLPPPPTLSEHDDEGGESEHAVLNDEYSQLLCQAGQLGYMILLITERVEGKVAKQLLDKNDSPLDSKAWCDLWLASLPLVNSVFTRRPAVSWIAHKFSCLIFDTQKKAKSAPWLTLESHPEVWNFFVLLTHFMVHYPDQKERSASLTCFRQFVKAFEPHARFDLLATATECPYGSVAALMVHMMKEEMRAAWSEGESVFVSVKVAQFLHGILGACSNHEVQADMFMQAIDMLVNALNFYYLLIVKDTDDITSVRAAYHTTTKDVLDTLTKKTNSLSTSETPQSPTVAMNLFAITDAITRIHQHVSSK